MIAVNVRPARVVLRLLAACNEPLSGDLLEAFRAALGGMALGSAAAGLSPRLISERQAPVALNLTSIDPVVAEWLMSKVAGAPINLSAPGEGIGGLGLMALGLLLTSVVPDVWWFVVGGIVGGFALGMTLAYRRRLGRMATDGRIHTGQLKDLFA